MTDPVPLTLLTGFLGSGKTTILNRLLRDPAFADAMVVVNEFGEIGLDHELIASGSDDVVVMQSGCLCCALRSDLEDTLIDLLARREVGELSFSRLVIETSGLADPTPILHTLLTSAALNAVLAVDGIVATVCAATGAATLDRHEEARRQVALADLLLLTKTDLPEADEAATRARLARINAGAPALAATLGEVRPARLLGLKHFDPKMSAEAAADWLRDADIPAPAAEGPPTAHLDAIRSISWTSAGPISADAFDIWMELLMARRGEDILRFKGLIHMTDAPHPFVVHGVQHIFHPPVLLRDWDGADRRCRMVMILRDFTDPELRELFEALEALPATEHVLPSGYLSAEPLE